MFRRILKNVNESGELLMKKILSIVLALCLALSLSVAVFANGSPSPGVNGEGFVPGGSTGFGSAGAGFGFNLFSASSNGLPLLARSTREVPTNDPSFTVGVPEGATAVGGVEITFDPSTLAGLSDGATVTVDVGLPSGVTEGLTMCGDDAWEVIPGSSYTIDNGRLTIQMPAWFFKKGYTRIGFFDNWPTETVDIPAEPTDNDSDNEQVSEPAPEVDAPVDTEQTTPADTAPVEQNPGTGIALAVVPMLVAAVAAVVSKRR